MTVDTLSDEKMAEIARGCEGVTAGPWFAEIEQIGLTPPVERTARVRSGELIVAMTKPGVVEGRYALTADYIARLDPSTVLSLVTELQSLRATIDGLRSERDEALNRVEELEGYGEDVAAEFEKDCWKAMRSLLDECGFDWSGGEAVTAEDARETIREELKYRHDCFIRAKTRAEAAEASLTTARADGIEVERLRVALKPFAAEADRIDPNGPDPTVGDSCEVWQIGEYPINQSKITYGDLRRARTALSPPANEPAKDETEVTR
jgi:hypothetical protein